MAATVSTCALESCGASFETDVPDIEVFCCEGCANSAEALANERGEYCGNGNDPRHNITSCPGFHS